MLNKHNQKVIEAANERGEKIIFYIGLKREKLDGKIHYYQE